MEQQRTASGDYATQYRVVFESIDAVTKSLHLCFNQVVDLEQLCRSLYEIPDDAEFHVCLRLAEERQIVRVVNPQEFSCNKIPFEIAEVQIIPTNFTAVRFRFGLNNSEDNDEHSPAGILFLPQMNGISRFRELVRAQISRLVPGTIEDFHVMGQRGIEHTNALTIRPGEVLFIDCKVSEPIAGSSGKHACPEEGSSMVTPVRPSKAPTHLTPMEQEVTAHIVCMGFRLSPESVKKLASRTSTVDGAIEYYFANMHLFPAASTSDIDNGHFEPNEDIMEIVDIDTDADAELARRLEQEEIAGRKALFQAPKECPICRDEMIPEEMYVLDCSGSHKYHVRCLYMHAKMALLGNAGQAHIPACPEANGRGGCNHLMTDKELKDIIRLNHEDTSMEEKRDLKQRVEKILFLKAMQDQHFVRCPNCKASDDREAFWIAPPDQGWPRGRHGHAVTCGRCNVAFCAQCMSSPYHYRCQCTDVMRYARAWTEWVAGGRDRYVTVMRAKEEQYLKERGNFEEQKRKHDEEAKAAEKRFQELQGMEQWKSTHCKCCPKCKRVVEKLSGCDSMKCGQNYHGGDIQNGCGASFNWSSALPYTAETGAKRLPRELDIRPPEEVTEIVHEIAPGINENCDNCREEVKGPLIRCLNCPALTLCLRCSTDGNFMPHIQRCHNASHTCMVDFGPGGAAAEEEVAADLIDLSEEEAVFLADEMEVDDHAKHKGSSSKEEGGGDDKCIVS